MAFCKDYVLLVKIVALIDITIYGLSSMVVGLFFILLLFVPGRIHQMVELDPDEHVEIATFLDFSEGAQIAIVLSIWFFRVFLTILALLLLRWSKKRYMTGLSLWLIVNIVLAIIFFPVDLKYMSYSSFSVDAVAICIISYMYATFSIWAVWSLRQLIIVREGQIPQTVEFKAL